METKATWAAMACVVQVSILAGHAAAGAREQQMIEYLTKTTVEQLKGCQIKAHDGTIMYTPDGKGNYAALWTRDFAYMVENAGDLIPLDRVEACIRYLLGGMRDDGATPDRVQADGRAVYVAGPVDHPLGLPNLDNAPFLVIAIDGYLKRLPADRRSDLFREWSPLLDRAMDYIPRSGTGLVHNDPDRPHSPYGFTDCIGKTGELFKESLLYWRACRYMERLQDTLGQAAKTKDYRDRAEKIERHVSVLWDDKAGTFLAASKNCRQVDIWGNAYAVYIDFPLDDKRDRIVRFLIDNYDRYVWRGQVRHLLKGQYWQRLLTGVPRDRYQNGAYWATASGWVMVAIAEKDPDLARRMFADLIDDFKTGGVCECINEGYRKLENYVNSATNPLAAARQLWGRSNKR